MGSNQGGSIDQFQNLLKKYMAAYCHFKTNPKHDQIQTKKTKTL